MSLSRLLNTGRSALLANQAGIATSGHNVANAGTPGYSRQRANLTNTGVRSQGYASIGTGVTVTGIERIRNTLIDAAYRRELSGQAEAGTRRDSLRQIEAAIADLSPAGVSEALSDLMQSFADLESLPSGSTERDMVQQRAISLTQRINNAADRILQAADDVVVDLETKLGRANQILGQVAELNTQIARAEAPSGGSASDLRDERDRVLDELSEMMAIEITEDENGRVSVRSEGAMLVNQRFHQTLTLEEIGGSYEFGMEGTIHTANIGGGSLGAGIELLNETIPGHLAGLDQWVEGFVDRVNAIHLPGVNPNGTTGIAFFDPAGTDALSFQVSEDVLDDSLNIAAGTSGAPAHNDVAAELANLRFEAQAAFGGETFQDGFSRLGARLGSEISSADTDYFSQEELAQNLAMQREAESGVSMEEELIQIMRFNHAFNAAAQVISTADEMFLTVLNM